MGERTFRHGAAMVSTGAQLEATVHPFVEEGLRAGDMTVLACSPETVAFLRRSLGDRAGGLVVDEGVSLRAARPPDAFVATRRHMEQASRAPSGRLRILAEVDFGRDPAGWREGQLFESVCNHFVAQESVTSLCVYDGRRLPAAVVAGAALTHPLLVSGASWTGNPSYREPQTFLHSLPRPREAVESGPPALVVTDAPSLPELRHTLGDALTIHVPDVLQREDMHLGVSEIAANAFRHGTRPVSARVWADGNRVICVISDRGTSYNDPLSGFTPAHGLDLSHGGMGLWLARKLWDHVDVLPTESGLSVRLSTRLR